MQKYTFEKFFRYLTLTFKREVKVSEIWIRKKPSQSTNKSILESFDHIHVDGSFNALFVSMRSSQEQVWFLIIDSNRIQHFSGSQSRWEFSIWCMSSSTRLGSYPTFKNIFHPTVKEIFYPTLLEIFVQHSNFFNTQRFVLSNTQIILCQALKKIFCWTLKEIFNLTLEKISYTTAMKYFIQQQRNNLSRTQKIFYPKFKEMCCPTKYYIFRSL